VKLKRATVEITDDPVTKTIEIALPWVTKDKEGQRLLEIPNSLIAAQLSPEQLIYILISDNFRSSFE
jgi:hypothetical protein